MSLHDALITGNHPKACRLIRRRVDINTRDKDGDTPLMLAVRRSGQEYLTQLLLAAGADVNMRNEIGETALMLALHDAENQENVSRLVHAGADTGLTSRYGYGACDYALKHACYDLLFPDNFQRRAVRALIRDADLDVVKAVCREQAIDANLLRLSLLDAVYFEDIARAKLLLELGAPAECQSFYGRSALMQAACRAHLDVVKLLLRYGADPGYQDHQGRTVLSEMATCVPGLRMTELIYSEEYALELLGEKRLTEIVAAQREVERLVSLN